MSDWEIIDTKKSNVSDWEVDQPSPSLDNENLLGSLAKAPFRVANDLVGGLARGLLSIPQYASKATTEVPGLFDLLTNNPLRALAQSGAGLTELGHNLLNTPKAIGDYASDRLHLLPKSIAEKIPSQRDISQDIDLTFGKPELAGEELARGLARNLPAITGAAKIAPKLVEAVNPLKYTAKNIAKDIVETKNEMKGKYSDLYTNIFKEAEEKGGGNLSHLVPKIDIQTLREYSPHKDILGVEEFIKNPTTQTAHNAKSDLLAIQRKLDNVTTKRTAERKQIKAVKDAVDTIKDNMFKAENGKINTDLLNKYNQIQKGYKEEVRPYTGNKDIRAYENNELSAKELLPRLSRGKFAAQRGQYHPEIKRREALKDALIKLGIGGGVVGGGKTLYDYLVGNNKEY